MRKLIVVLLMAGLLFAAGNSEATMNRFNQDQKILMVTKTNTSATTGIITDMTSSTVLVPGVHRILGWSVGPIGGATAELYATLYDSDAITDNLDPDTLLIGESESYNNGGTKEVWFPYPREITEGVILGQGVRSCVTIYYEDYRR